MKSHCLWSMQLVPRMLSDSLNVYTLTGICNENTSNHVFGLIREKVRRLILSIKYLFIKIGRPLILKRKVPAEHGVQDDTTTPEVTHQSVVVFASDHL